MWSLGSLIRVEQALARYTGPRLHFQHMLPAVRSQIWRIVGYSIDEPARIRPSLYKLWCLAKPLTDYFQNGGSTVAMFNRRSSHGGSIEPGDGGAPPTLVALIKAAANYALPECRSCPQGPSEPDRVLAASCAEHFACGPAEAILFVFRDPNSRLPSCRSSRYYE